jgi:hypothetical protein
VVLTTANFGGFSNFCRYYTRFEEEFDFESANAQFDKEEIERELKEKLVIGMNMSITASLDVYNIAVIAIFFFF